MVSGFDLGDLIGRILPGCGFTIVGPRGVIFAAVLRIIFFPMFLFNTPKHKPSFMSSDVISYAIMMLFRYVFVFLIKKN